MSTHLHDVTDVPFRDDGMPQRYVRVKDAARITGLPVSTLYDALYGEQLKGYRVGQRWLIAVEDLDRWIRGESDAA